MRSGCFAKGSLNAPCQAGYADAYFLRSRDPAVSFSAAAGDVGEMEAAMQSIIKANVERFKLLLSTETDPTKWAMEIRLLAEEEEKLAKMPKPEDKEG